MSIETEKSLHNVKMKIPWLIFGVSNFEGGGGAVCCWDTVEVWGAAVSADGEGGAVTVDTAAGLEPAVATAVFWAADARRGGGGGIEGPPLEVLAPLSIQKTYPFMCDKLQQGQWNYRKLGLFGQ